MPVYSEKIATQPTSEPVTLTEAKAHLYESDTAFDTRIESLITVARIQIEQWTDLALLTQTWDYWTPIHFSRHYPYYRQFAIKIPRGPVASVDAVETIDDSGTATAVDSSTYVVDLLSEPCEIRFLNGVPDGRIHLRYTAGVDSPDDVPAPLKQAILLLVGALYDNRTEEVIAAATLTTIRLQLGVDSLIRNYKWGDRC
jgi:uncharacterized phiE125 gp8 family phage protein